MQLRLTLEKFSHCMSINLWFKLMKNDNPSRVALLVTRRSADRRVAGSSPGRNASRRCTRSATLWAQGIGDWELFSHGISARASMWDMQEASGRYLITGLRVWKLRSKQTNKYQRTLFLHLKHHPAPKERWIVGSLLFQGKKRQVRPKDIVLFVLISASTPVIL